MADLTGGQKRACPLGPPTKGFQGPSCWKLHLRFIYFYFFLLKKCFGKSLVDSLLWALKYYFGDFCTIIWCAQGTRSMRSCTQNWNCHSPPQNIDFQVSGAATAPLYFQLLSPDGKVFPHKIGDWVTPVGIQARWGDNPSTWGTETGLNIHRQSAICGCWIIDSWILLVT